MQITASYSIQSATTGYTAYIFPYRSRVSLKEAFEGPEPDEGKLSCPVLRGLAPSDGGGLIGKPTSRNAKGIIWRKRFGVREHFAFSGICSVASAPYVIRRSPGSRDGVFIIASPV